MKMYEGVLHGLSGGEVIPTGPTHMRETAFGNWVPAGRRAYAGMTRREFIDIGDDHVKTVMVTPYHDELLKESLGQEVAFTITGMRNGRKRIVALRTPKRGVDKIGFGAVLGSSIFQVAVWWVGAVIFSFLLAFTVVPILGFIFKPLGWAAGAALILGFVAMLVGPFYLNWDYYRAWKALGPAGHPVPGGRATA